MYRLFFALLLSSLFSAALFGQETQEGEAPKTETKAAVLPEPGALSADWWRYFEVGEPDIELRVKMMSTRLQSLLQELLLEEQEAGKANIDRFLSNLDALTKVREKKSDEPPVLPLFKASYTLEEWLALERQFRAGEKEVQGEQMAADQLKKVLQGAEQNYDNLLAAYLPLNAADPTKVLKGLEIMADRSALEIARRQLIRHKKELDDLELKFKTLSTEKKTALERLSETSDAIDTYSKKSEEQKQSLMRAKKLLNKANSRVLGAVAETPEAQSNNKLNEQRVIQAAVNENIAQLHLTLADAKMFFIPLLVTANVDTAQLHDHLTEWQKLVKSTQANVVVWRAESLREQNRAQAQLLVQPPPSTALNKINVKRNQQAQETLLKLQELDDTQQELGALIEAFKLYLLKREGVVKHGLVSFGKTLMSGWEIASSWMTESLFKIGETPVTAFGLLRVVMILVIAMTFSKLLRRMLQKIAEHKDGEGSALYTIGRLAHYVILLLGLMIALSSIGLDFSNLALVAGALSVGIGFGLQSIVNNFVSGLILLFEQTVKVGDYLELDSGVRGTVKEINVRSTLVNTNDNIDIIVPNSELVSAKVTNWTLREAIRRLRVPFGVAYGTDKELVKTAALEAAERVNFTMRGSKRREPQVWLVNFGESSLDFELVVWVSQSSVKRPSAVLAAYMWELETSLTEHGIEIPFPQRDLHVRSLFGEKDEAGKVYFDKGQPPEGIKC